MGRNFQISVLHNMIMCVETKTKIISMYIWIRVGKDRETDFERQKWGTLSYNVTIHSHYQQRTGFEYCNYMGRNSNITYFITQNTS